MEQVFSVGELDDSLVSHDAWRLRLHSAAMAKERSLPVATIARADQCQLGRWLSAGAGEDAAGGPLAHLRRRHNQFHQEAGRIAAMIEAGQFDAALRALAGAEFTSHSRALRDAIEAARPAVSRDNAAPA